jgi:hypothetical protein
MRASRKAHRLRADWNSRQFRARGKLWREAQALGASRRASFNSAPVSCLVTIGNAALAIAIAPSGRRRAQRRVQGALLSQSCPSGFVTPPALSKGVASLTPKCK